MAKLSLALVVMAAGCFGMLRQEAYVASDASVITASVVALRAPIDGIVSQLPPHIGATIEKAAEVAQLEDPDLNDGHLVDLREHLARLDAVRAGASQERATLILLRAELQQRADVHRQATEQRLTAEMARAEAAIAAKLAEQEQDARTLTRKERLTKSGVVAPADLEVARSVMMVAQRQTDASRADLAALAAQAMAARQGIIADPSAPDVIYSAQRADELTIRIADLERQIGEIESEAHETAARLKDEAGRHERLGHATVRATISGTVWRLAASDGERVAKGDLLGELIDCQSQYLYVAIPQERVPDVIWNGDVHFRLSGELSERRGLVEYVGGDMSPNVDRHLAAIPPPDSPAQARVRVRLDPAMKECLVGRTARVLLPASRGALAHWLDRFL